MSADDEMVEPISLAEVEQRILRLDALLEQATHAGKKRWEEDARADARYDAEFAKAFLLAKQGELPGQEKPDSDMTAKQRATALCEDLLLERNIAKARLESAREAGRNYRSSVESLRSINANVRHLTVEGA